MTRTAKHCIKDLLYIVQNIHPNANGCQIWTGTINDYGFAYYYMHQKSHLVHRLIFEHFYPEKAKNSNVIHLCKVKNCCNIQHMEQRSYDCGPKLSKEKATEIRSLYPSMSVNQLAMQYDVSTTTINLILKGKIWKT